MIAALDNLSFETGSQKPLDDLFQGAASQASDLGFEFCAFYLRFPVPVSNPTVATFDNHPPAWRARFRAKNYLAIDPTLGHALHYQSSVVWSGQVFAAAPGLWNDMRAHGLKVGWAQPARDARNVVGLLTVARSEGPLCPHEIKEKQPMLAWIAQTTHLGMTRHLAPQIMPSINATLTQREIDVLRWTAEGKTANEISSILDISERTVNYHANNAVSKLRVANKTAAATHAALLGIL